MLLGFSVRNQTTCCCLVASVYALLKGYALHTCLILIADALAILMADVLVSLHKQAMGFTAVLHMWTATCQGVQ